MRAPGRPNRSPAIAVMPPLRTWRRLAGYLASAAFISRAWPSS